MGNVNKQITSLILYQKIEDLIKDMHQRLMKFPRSEKYGLALEIIRQIKGHLLLTHLFYSSINLLYNMPYKLKDTFKKEPNWRIGTFLKKLD